MNLDFNREWLTKKFEEIRTRILKVLGQLNDEHVNWQPNHTSLSISTIIKHIDGNIQERISKGILHWEIHRNRDAELLQTYIAKAELENMIQQGFDLIISTLKQITDQQLQQKQLVRSRERSNLDMLHQCAVHYSEHMGQIFYIAKQLLQEQYKSTSI